MNETKKRRSLNTYEILLLVLAVISLITVFLNGQGYIGADGKSAKVVGAGLDTFLTAPINGFYDAREVIGFCFCLGAFLALVTATGALETGINVLVKKLNGKEIVLIPIMMFLFSVGGTTYGMGEETVGFYILLASTMLAAGMDPLVGAATVLLGAGTGVLGSTVNPFAVGAAVDAAKGVDVKANMGTILVLGVILWLGAYIISTIYVVNYAKKVKAGKGSIFTHEQLEECRKAFNQGESSDELTGRQKVCLWLFAFAFVVMIFGFIPWGSLNKGVYNAFGWSKFLTGAQLGDWYFTDAATWFILMGLIIALIGMEDKSKLPTVIEAGIADMIGVNLVIALARATTVVMNTTGMGAWLVQVAVNGIKNLGMGGGIFEFLNYLLHLVLSFLVPSSSGLAGLSAPIMTPIVQQMGWSPEVGIMTIVGANGLVNLFTPTCGFIMGGLALARVPYTSYVAWVKKLLGILFVFTGAVLVIGMIVL